MELHEKFEYSELREAIFGYAPEYSDKFDLAIFLRRIVILSATFARAYYKNKRCQKENMTSRTIDRIVDRPFISIDNSISILSALQNAGEDLDELGLSALRILSDEKQSDYINLYEVKAVLQDDTGKFFDAVFCKETIKKVIACVSFITKTEIKSDEDRTWFIFDGETFDISSLFKHEFCYLYCTLQEVDPLITSYVPL